jgi:hypothetical protein
VAAAAVLALAAACTEQTAPPPAPSPTPSASPSPVDVKLCPVVNDVLDLLDEFVAQSVTPDEAAARLRRDQRRVKNLLPRLRAESPEQAATAADLARHLDRTADTLEAGEVGESTNDLARALDDVQALQEQGLRC